MFELYHQGVRYAVPRPSLDPFFNCRPELLSALGYEVQSFVPVDIFATFVQSLQTRTKVEVTAANVDFLLLLAHEFFLNDLKANCACFLHRSPNTVPDLADRLLLLEKQISASGWRTVQDTLSGHEAALAAICQRLSALEESLWGLKSAPNPPPTSAAPIAAPPAVRLPKDGVFVMKAPRSLDGIIAYLTAKHGGNVSAKGIVTITAKSYESLAQNVAELKEQTSFYSAGSSGQWLSWDFRERRVTLTNYTLTSYYLKTWALEGSLDGDSWFLLDRRKDTQDFVKYGAQAASFDVTGKPRQCRFLRITQTASSHNKDDYLILYAVEFFGTLKE
jgi:hypothetical protein